MVDNVEGEFLDRLAGLRCAETTSNAVRAAISAGEQRSRASAAAAKKRSDSAKRGWATRRANESKVTRSRGQAIEGRAVHRSSYSTSSSSRASSTASSTLPRYTQPNTQSKAASTTRTSAAAAAQRTAAAAETIILPHGFRRLVPEFNKHQLVLQFGSEHKKMNKDLNLFTAITLLGMHQDRVLQRNNILKSGSGADNEERAATALSVPYSVRDIDEFVRLLAQGSGNMDPRTTDAVALERFFTWVCERDCARIAVYDLDGSDLPTCHAPKQHQHTLAGEDGGLYHLVRWQQTKYVSFIWAQHASSEVQQYKIAIAQPLSPPPAMRTGSTRNIPADPGGHATIGTHNMVKEEDGVTTSEMGVPIAATPWSGFVIPRTARRDFHINTDGNHIALLSSSSSLSAPSLSSDTSSTIAATAPSTNTSDDSDQQTQQTIVEAAISSSPSPVITGGSFSGVKDISASGKSHDDSDCSVVIPPTEVSNGTTNAVVVQTSIASSIVLPMGSSNWSPQISPLQLPPSHASSISSDVMMSSASSLSRVNVAQPSSMSVSSPPPPPPSYVSLRTPPSRLLSPISFGPPITTTGTLALPNDQSCRIEAIAANGSRSDDGVDAPLVTIPFAPKSVHATDAKTAATTGRSNLVSPLRKPTTPSPPAAAETVTSPPPTSTNASDDVTKPNEPLAESQSIVVESSNRYPAGTLVEVEHANVYGTGRCMLRGRVIMSTPYTYRIDFGRQRVNGTSHSAVKPVPIKYVEESTKYYIKYKYERTKNVPIEYTTENLRQKVEIVMIEPDEDNMLLLRRLYFKFNKVPLELGQTMGQPQLGDLERYTERGLRVQYIQQGMHKY